MPLPATVTDALAHQNAARFCEAILPVVSRTFALGIKVLPGDLGQAVLDAYLLCRIADTVEDAPGIPPDVKAALFDDFLAGFTDADALARFTAGVQELTGDLAHLTLTRNTPLVLEHFGALPQRTQDVVRRWVTEMSVGMRKFVLLYPNGIRIQTVEEYKEYCYYVAGTVGYMLTDLWHEHSPSIGAKRYAILRERCRAFAEALQTVNILKDVAVDAEKENSVYIPEELLEAHGSSQSRILAPEPRRAGPAHSARLARSRRSAHLPARYSATCRVHPAVLHSAAAAGLRHLARSGEEFGDVAARRLGEDLAAGSEVAAAHRRHAGHEQQRCALAGGAGAAATI